MQSKSLLYIFGVFLKLGCTSFGGPAAHLVFFHQYFVQRNKWLTDDEYSQIMALAQLLPGPTSSQTGIGIGYMQRGYAGALAAWLGFTLPSTLLMALAAIWGQHYFHWMSSQSFHVIQLIVLAVIIAAFWQMSRSFCKTLGQKLLMLFAAAYTVCLPSGSSQIFLILIAGAIGILCMRYAQAFHRHDRAPAVPPALVPMTGKQKRRSLLWLMLFLMPFAISLVIPSSQHWIHLFHFYQSASMVFGGGHIILPLMYQDFVAAHHIPAEAFNAGYALAQLMPGPLFSFASYLGALLAITPWPWLNAAFATIAIFLPSFLLMFAAIPCWTWLMQQAALRSAVASINAAVVGLLLAMIFQMGSHYVMQAADLIFLAILTLLLRTPLPIWLSIIGSFIVYTAVLSG